MSMVLGGMSGTGGVLDPRSVAHLERCGRQDRTNARGEWNRAVSATLTVAYAGMVSCRGENRENVDRNNGLGLSQRWTECLTGCTSRGEGGSRAVYGHLDLPEDPLVDPQGSSKI